MEEITYDVSTKNFNQQGVFECSESSSYALGNFEKRGIEDPVDVDASRAHFKGFPRSLGKRW